MANDEQVAEALDDLDERELLVFIAARLVAVEKELRSIGWWVSGAMGVRGQILGVRRLQ